jgi:hypothetical protein
VPLITRGQEEFFLETGLPALAVLGIAAGHSAYQEGQGYYALALNRTPLSPTSAYRRATVLPTRSTPPPTTKALAPNV